MAESSDILEMENPIQAYAWGSRTAIADLCGKPSPSLQPQAELWMGAHSKAPSRVKVDGRWTPLDRFIAASPETVLGERVARLFGNRLPYLFKILAVASPLSVQAHPDAHQAADGFARENAAGIPLNAPHRNYRDDSAKPEIICALTDFTGLNGFRAESEIRDNLAAYCPRLLAMLPKRTSARSGMNTDGGLKALYHNVMTLEAAKRRQVVEDCLDRLNGRRRELEHVIHRLSAAYPGDIGILSPLLLNLVRLRPGEAMYLPAGQLHAYLEGTGIELMANSDNVLRGGLTPKHVDTDELLRILRFESVRVKKLACREVEAHLCRYDTPAMAFSLSVVRVRGTDVCNRPGGDGPQILLTTAGQATVSWREGRRSMLLARGASAMVPAAVGQYRVSGDATVHVAGVPVD